MVEVTIRIIIPRYTRQKPPIYLYQYFLQHQYDAYFSQIP